MSELDEGRPPLWDERADVWETDYVYRRHLSERDLLPAVGIGAIAGLAAFYLARIMIQRTSLRPEKRPRSARLPEPRREPR
jgi:hypothetical protein